MFNFLDLGHYLSNFFFGGGDFTPKSLSFYNLQDFDLSVKVLTVCSIHKAYQSLQFYAVWGNLSKSGEMDKVFLGLAKLPQGKSRRAAQASLARTPPIPTLLLNFTFYWKHVLIVFSNYLKFPFLECNRKTFLNPNCYSVRQTNGCMKLHTHKFLKFVKQQYFLL